VYYMGMQSDRTSQATNRLDNIILLLYTIRYHINNINSMRYNRKPDVIIILPNTRTGHRQHTVCIIMLQ